MSQTSYSIDQAAAIEGMIADISPVQDVVTGQATAGAVQFGKFVAKGSGDADIIHPAAATDITSALARRGVILAAQTFPSSASGNPQSPQFRPANVLRKGRIWVKPEDTVNPTQNVNVRYAGVGQAGSFRGAAVASETAVLANAKWLSTTTSAGQLALLEIDL